MIELDFAALDAPEMWHKIGAEALPEEFVDLHPGRLIFRIAGS